MGLLLSVFHICHAKIICIWTANTSIALYRYPNELGALSVEEQYCLNLWAVNPWKAVFTTDMTWSSEILYYDESKSVHIANLMFDTTGSSVVAGVKWLKSYMCKYGQ